MNVTVQGRAEATVWAVQPAGSTLTWERWVAAVEQAGNRIGERDPDGRRVAIATFQQEQP